MRFHLRDFFSSRIIPVDFACGLDLAAAPNIAAEPIGLYACLGNDRVGLFAVGDKLFLVVNDKLYDAPSEKTAISHSRQQDVRELKIRLAGDDYVFRYGTFGPISTPFYTEDEEDSDFGLWLQNVLRSDERRRVLKDAWRGGMKRGRS